MLEGYPIPRSEKILMNLRNLLTKIEDSVDRVNEKDSKDSIKQKVSQLRKILPDDLRLSMMSLIKLVKTIEDTEKEWTSVSRNGTEDFDNFIELLNQLFSFFSDKN